jgi:hypothetical protein
MRPRCWTRRLQRRAARSRLTSEVSSATSCISFDLMRVSIPSGDSRHAPIRRRSAFVSDPS